MSLLTTSNRNDTNDHQVIDVVPVLSGGFIGRRDHCQRLVQAYECAINGASSRTQHLVMIRGHSGTGKTSLARSLQRRVETDDSGFFLTGKFELLGVKNPYAVFVSAFTQYTDKLLGDLESSPNNDVRVPIIRQAIQDAVGRDGRLLTNMIPSLERLIGHQLEPCDAHGAEALNRFQFAFCKFCRAISTITPLVLFLDDLQWSDTASLNLLLALLQSEATSECKSSLLVIGAYRDEGLHEDIDNPSEYRRLECPLQSKIRAFDDLSSGGRLHLTEINLQNLDEKELDDLVAAYLQRPSESIGKLTRIIYSRCHGNPFHAVQLIRLLVGKGLLHQDSAVQSQWTWDENDVLQASSSTETIDELVHQKLMSLPTLTQELLNAVACMGDVIDMSALAAVFNQETMPTLELSLQAALRDGHLVLDRQHAQYRFAHDRIRQIVLSTVEDKEDLSFQIGYKLWKRSSHHFLDTNLFLVANLLNYGTNKITEQSERYMVAALDLEAGVKAMTLAAFSDACRYLTAGIELLKGGDYWDERYSLTLELYTAAADVALLNQDFRSVDELTNTVLEHARSVKDSFTSYVARINAAGQQNNMSEAFNVGFEVLRKLGEPLPARANLWAIIMDDVKTKIAIRWQSDDALLGLPPMQNEDKIVAMHILASLLPYMFRAASSYTPLISTRLVRLGLRFGLHQGCAIGFVTYGWVSCTSQHNLAYRLGSLALSILEKQRAREMVPRVHAPFYGFIHHWKRPLRESLEPLKRSEKVGMEIGDVEYAIVSLQFRCMHAFWCGMSLRDLDGVFVDAVRKMDQYKQASPYKASLPFLQYIHNLTGRSPTPKLLAGDVVGLFDTSECLDDKTIPYDHFILGMDLAFMFGDLVLAEQNLERRRALNFHPRAAATYACDCFKEALVCVALVRLGSSRRKHIKVANTMWKRLRAWAKDCDSNFLHKQRLVEAELQSLSRHISARRSIQALYDDSINGALEEKYTQEAALACELAGNYMSRNGRSKEAEAYWRRARDLYFEWGATEKASQLSLRMRR